MYVARIHKGEAQLLKDHLENVSQYASKQATSVGLSNLVALCGYIHDMGKYSDGFQKYINSVNDSKRKQGKKVDHGVHGAQYIYEKIKPINSLENLVVDIIAEVVCYHHGGLPDFLNSDFENPLTKRLNVLDKGEYQIVVGRFEVEMEEIDFRVLFSSAVQEIDVIVKRYKNLKSNLSLLIKHIYSFIVDADRWDSFLFEAKLDEKVPEVEKLWLFYSKNLEEKLERFKAKEVNTELESTVKQMREYVSDTCDLFASNPTGIYTLTVPTGGGKTLASLRLALNHCIKQKKRRIIYIMPYTTIIEQNANEVKKILGCGEHLLEFHSNVIDDDKNEEYEILSERWTSPIIFTTMVQFLNAIFAKGNGNIRRLHQLSDAVIVFDEIQTLPIKCMALFYSAIEYLKEIGNTTSVLCTATQPNYDFITDKFKIHIDKEIIPNVGYVFEKLKRMQVVDKTNTPMDAEQLTDFTWELKENAASVLIIMNTVNSAVEVFDSIVKTKRDDTELFILTSRMCPKHRQDTIKQIKELLRLGVSLVCVTTQLIEAGVDISFSKVIRSLAGMDSIAQAAGRGNRHGESEVSELYIIKYKDEVISGLTEIKIGQGCTQNVLHLLNSKREQTTDLLAPQAIDMYYTKYYNDEDVEKNMYYPIVDSSDRSIYKLLSCDNKRKKRIYPKGSNITGCTIQFKSARDNFEVIDSQTVTLLVPYDEEAKNAIGILVGNATSLGEKYEMLKCLQKYCVNIYQNLYKHLLIEHALISNDMEEIHILSTDYYDAEKGIVKEKQLKLTIL